MISKTDPPLKPLFLPPPDEVVFGELVVVFLKQEPGPVNVALCNEIY